MTILQSSGPQTICMHGLCAEVWSVCYGGVKVHACTMGRWVGQSMTSSFLFPFPFPSLPVTSSRTMMVYTSTSTAHAHPSLVERLCHPYVYLNCGHVHFKPHPFLGACQCTSGVVDLCKGVDTIHTPHTPHTPH